MTLRTRNRLMTFSILAGPFVFFLGLLLFWDAEPLPPVPPLPHPNGYDDLVKAGEMITGDVGNYDKLSGVELRTTAQSNSNALQLARTGLREACRVPIQSSRGYLSNHLEELTDIKRLTQAWVVEGKWVEAEGHPEAAARIYLEVIHLGNQSSRGGVIIDELVGIAVETIGAVNLQKLAGQLDAKTCREAAATLETLDSQRQTWDEVMQQERDWSRRAFPGIRYELVRLMDRNSMQTIHQKAGQQFDKQEGKTRQLIIELAARAYELDKGHPPANLADLVPDYLKAIPQDPATGTNLVYSP